MKSNKGFRGDRLRALREHYGLTQTELGQRVGITQTLEQRHESNRHGPSLDTVAAYARELNCSIDYLMGVVNETNQYLMPQDLSKTEQALLNAYRMGDLNRVLQILVNAPQQATPATTKPEPAKRL